MDCSNYHGLKLNCFISKIEHCQESNVSHKILLVIDNTHGHPAHIDDICPNMKVTFLLSNTKSYRQPMDQGIVANHKKLLSKMNIWSFDVHARARTHTHTHTYIYVYITGPSDRVVSCWDCGFESRCRHGLCCKCCDVR